MSFRGYRRPDGSVGVRNYIGVISTVSCANDVTWWIAQRVKGCAPFIHGQGCTQTQPDLEQVNRTLISLGWNPNLAGVLVISLGCESLSADRIVQGIAQSGKAVAKVVIQKIGGSMLLSSRAPSWPGKCWLTPRNRSESNSTTRSWSWE